MPSNDYDPSNPSHYANMCKTCQKGTYHTPLIWYSLEDLCVVSKYSFYSCTNYNLL